MLRTIAFAVLIGIVSTAAIAQQSKPSPSPTPAPYGTPAGTQGAVDAYNKQLAAYQAQSADPNATLAELDHTHQVLYSYREEALRAATIEAERNPTREIKDLQRQVDVQESVYRKLHEDKKDLQADANAKSKLDKLQKALYDATFAKAKQLLRVANNGTELWDAHPLTERHLALLRAADAAKKKAEAEKKAQEQQNAEPKKTSCAPGSGITGLTENIACQEQHSGSGH